MRSHSRDPLGSVPVAHSKSDVEDGGNQSPSQQERIFVTKKGFTTLAIGVDMDVATEVIRHVAAIVDVNHTYLL